MTRFAASGKVTFWEEPKISMECAGAHLNTRRVEAGIIVVTPIIPANLSPEETVRILRSLLDGYVDETSESPIGWYYTPMMLPFSRHIDFACTVYDCMDELANFRFAPPDLVDLEKELFAAADLVFTGGYSLYEAKRAHHPSVHPFPSSVDRAHFALARSGTVEPADQRGLARPRLGFYGVVDERMDLALLAELADARPEWTLVIVGPVVKIDPADLPRRPNISYLGAKTYAELPLYAAGWDVALMPFAINESTRFISPTKTPEYLAAGLPVVATPVIDVVRHYGELEGVHIAGSVGAFVAACEQALRLPREPQAAWRTEVDEVLADLSWETVASGMRELMMEVLRAARPDRASPRKAYDYLVVGAGFAGAVMAERLAEDGGKTVLVIDRRPHVGGNAFDRLDEAGILIHQYGPHIFHTNSAEVVDYLSRFTKWHPYEHRVLADVRGRLVPMPINRTTLNLLYGLELASDAEAEAYLAERAEPVETVRTSEDVVVSKVGRELYETFFRGYSRKQWGIDPSELDKSVTARVPTRTNLDDRYFTDSFQAMPRDGYTAMFENMLDHPNIDVRLEVDFEEIRESIDYDKLVFTGPIDEYFGCCHGKLPYRSLEFRHETLQLEQFQSVGTVNYPDEATPYTRISEYKHLTGQKSPETSITYEYPRAEGDPYYPIPRPENQQLFKRYEALALGQSDVIFVGRLATYRYYNMDQVVAQALMTYRRHIAAEREAGDGREPSTAVAAE